MLLTSSCMFSLCVHWKPNVLVQVAPLLLHQTLDMEVVGLIPDCGRLSGDLCPLTSDACVKSIWWLWKQSCVSTDLEKARKHP